MYIFKADNNVKMNQTIASEVIGLAQPTLSNILNRKVACRKVVAFSIFFMYYSCIRIKVGLL